MMYTIAFFVCYSSIPARLRGRPPRRLELPAACGGGAACWTRARAGHGCHSAVSLKCSTWGGETVGRGVDTSWLVVVGGRGGRGEHRR